MSISVPPFSNVPAAGDPLSSAWAQQLTQYAVDLDAGRLTVGRGIVAYGNLNATDQSGIGATPVGIGGSTVAWTAIAGRLYRCTLWCTLQQNTAAGAVNPSILNDGVSQRGTSMTLAAGSLGHAHFFALFSPAAGAHTVSAQVSTTAGTVTVVGTFSRNGYILVEDLGKSVAPGLLDEPKPKRARKR